MTLKTSNDWKAFLDLEEQGSNGVIQQIVKRDGKVEQYDRWRIASAISRAIIAVTGEEDKELTEKLTARTEDKIREFKLTRHPNSIPAIEEIQDIVEAVLIGENRPAIAKAYIIYRVKHEAMRDAKKLMLDINTTMDGYLSQSDWRVNENANVNFSLGGLILHNSGTITAN